jgi:hypothetical protein
MWRVLLLAVLLAGCVPLPPSPQDIQAKRFEAAPGKAAIYVVRTPMDSHEGAGLSLDYGSQITTYEGTYWRWDVAPGPHRVASYGWGTAEVNINAEAGKIYFIRHTVMGHWRAGPQQTWLQPLSEPEGRTLVTRSEMLR